MTNTLEDKKQSLEELPAYVLNAEDKLKKTTERIIEKRHQLNDLVEEALTKENPEGKVEALSVQETVKRHIEFLTYRANRQIEDLQRLRNVSLDLLEDIVEIQEEIIAVQDKINRKGE